MQDHDQETEVVEEDVAATEKIVEENENEEVPGQEVPEVPLAPEAEAMKWKEAAIRSAADLDNYRKRMARERSEDLRFARSGLIEELLPLHRLSFWSQGNLRHLLSRNLLIFILFNNFLGRCDVFLNDFSFLIVILHGGNQYRPPPNVNPSLYYKMKPSSSNGPNSPASQPGSNFPRVPSRQPL